MTARNITEADWIELGKKAKKLFPSLNDDDYRILWRFSEEENPTKYNLQQPSELKRPFPKMFSLKVKQSAGYLRIDRLGECGLLLREGRSKSEDKAGPDAYRYRLTIKGELAAPGIFPIVPKEAAFVAHSRWCEKFCRHFKIFGRVLTSAESLAYLDFFYDAFTPPKFGWDMCDPRLKVETEPVLAILHNVAAISNVEGFEKLTRTLGLENNPIAAENVAKIKKLTSQSPPLLIRVG